MIKHITQSVGLAIVLAGGLGGLGTSSAQAQGFGLSINSPGLSVGVGNYPYYGGGYYGAGPVVVPQPVVVAPPPVIYAPQPYYRGGYGPGPGYGRGPGAYGGGYGRGPGVHGGGYGYRGPHPGGGYGPGGPYRRF